MAGPPSGGRGVAVAVLCAVHAAACAAILGTTATQLLYRGAAPPHRRCRLGADVTATSPCDYALALSAVALIGAAALLAASVATLLADAAVSVAEGVAARVRRPCRGWALVVWGVGVPASCGGRAWRCWRPAALRAARGVGHCPAPS